MSSPAPKENSAKENAYTVFRNPDFFRYLIARFIASFGMQMLVVAVDWELYERTHSALALGGVGLALMVPMFLCTLPAGHVADTFNRKKIILVTTFILALGSVALALVSWLIPDTAANVLHFEILMYSLLVVIGATRTFLWPASAAYVASLVPREQFARAVTFNSGAFQLSSVLGPAAGGLVIWLTHGAWLVYAFNALAAFVCFFLVLAIRHEHKVPPREPVTFRSLITGFQFVYHNKIILGTISLDMFAVLLGGAVALLPIFAKDILESGPDGLGLLRAAMPIGAVICTVIMAHRAPVEKAGRAMLLCVAVFGAATILFGLTNQHAFGKFFTAPNAFWFWLTFGLLALSGAVDNVSVIIRQTLVQILTPDEKRGRVSAVNSLFIGTSNELGGFESGFTAQLFGPMMAHSIATGTIISTVFGGFGTIAVVLAVAWIWPEIRRYGKLS
jgi:MFS family permease